ncbi:hypothetical protein NEOLEDRAFT_1148800 [Neolentinus lepideus HHB14362 ss-1]|uniref:Uncharacterized protein n=1 Tax=Neolentinus lepideus HHB14362 ss-1 TaxID=1314782 RepID=A0A165RRI2_9AGAM|nr:hypothetical protein NEOLEDRAFT_1148800 [Neolentinus lepideus HHB14362 ss-1]
MSTNDSDTPPSPLHNVPQIDSLDRLRRAVSGRTRERTSKDYASLSVRDVARMLIQEQRRNEALEQANFTLSSQLSTEVERSDAAEQRCKDLLIRLRGLNDEKLAAQREATRAKEELALYKVRLEEQRQEILRAQATVDDLEALRQSAETSAAKARTNARKMREETVIERAREQGRAEGFAAGVRSAFEDGRYVGYDEGREIVYGDETPAAFGALRNLPEARAQSVREREREPEPQRISEREPQRMPEPVSQQMPEPEHQRMPEPEPQQTPEPEPEPAPAPRQYRSSTPRSHRTRTPTQPDNFTPRHTGTPPLPPSPEEIRFIPPPTYPQQQHRQTRSDDNRQTRSDAITDSRPPRARRRSSPDSQSTTISQFGIVNESPPEPQPQQTQPQPQPQPQPRAREPPPYLRERRGSGLSVIPEVLSGATSPAPSFMNRTPEMTSFSQPQPSPFSQPPPPTTYSQPPPSTTFSQPPPPTTSFQPPPETGRQSRASRHSQPEDVRNSVSSGMSVPDITIVPPSRPGSNRSLQSHSAQGQGLLSPRDADRPLPTINDEEPPLPPTPGFAPMPGATPVSMGPIVLPNGQLFTPTEVVPTPAAGNASLPGGNSVPFPGATGAYNVPPTSVYMMHDAGESANTKPVIPEGYDARGRLPGTRYDSSSTETTTETATSGMSGDTLSTPPPKGKAKKGRTLKKSGPKSMSSTSAAGVPLPPSTIGSSTPHTSFYAQTPMHRANAGMTPGPDNRPLSFVTERSLGMGGFGREN